MNEGIGRDAGIFLVAGLCGIASGMFGIGGGVLLVPVLGLLFSFSQHRAQGTSLVALIPPTGALALMAYAREGFISDRKSTRLNSSHGYISYAVFCLKKKTSAKP